MKRTIMTIMLACVAMFMTQCKKSDVQKPVTGDTIDVTLTVDNGAKTLIGADGNVTWKIGDKIHIVGEQTGYLGCVKAENNGDPVRFSGTINYSTVKQILHYYYVGSSDFTLDEYGYYTFSIATGQNGTLETVADKCQLMYGKSEYAIPVGTQDLGTATLKTKTAIANFRFSREDNAPMNVNIKVSGAYTSMKFNARTGDFASSVKSPTDFVLNCDNYTAGDNYYIGLIPGQQTLSFSQYVVDKTLEQKTIEENALYQDGDGNGFAVEMLCPADMPRNVGALPGKFMISETQAVYFSKGNLVCNSDHTGWTFEANQWDYHSCPNGWQMENGVKTNTGCTKWGLFGFPTATNNYGASTSTNNNDYSGDFYDWKNVFGIGTVWFTMTKTQLEYLNTNAIQTNPYTSFTLGDKTINGFVFLPYTTPNDEVNDIKSAITGDLNKLSSYGGVFFPLTGRRIGGGLDSGSGNYGYMRYDYSGGGLFIYGPSNIHTIQIDGQFNYLGGGARLVCYPTPTK